MARVDDDTEFAEIRGQLVATLGTRTRSVTGRRAASLAATVAGGVNGASRWTGRIR
jgi:hypothetical protein